MPKQLSLCLKFFFWLKKKSGLRPGLNLKAGWPIFITALVKPALWFYLLDVLLLVSHELNTWFELGREWTPCLGECDFPLGLGVELSWGTASQATCLLPVWERAPWERMATLSPKQGALPFTECIQSPCLTLTAAWGGRPSGPCHPCSTEEEREAHTGGWREA